MPAIPELIAVRGEWVSLLIVAAVLTISTRTLSRLLALPRTELGDLFWNGGLAFVVFGRLVYVAIKSSEALTDPLVLIRIQGGIEPLAGLAAVAAVLAWRTRNDRGSLLVWLAAATAGLAVTVVSYDIACVARDACGGTTAPAPLGFTMSGLSDTRLATPLIEAALLLLAAGALLSSQLDARRAAIALGGIAALTRVALTPLSVLGSDALGLESVAFAVLGVALLAVAWRVTAAEGGLESPTEAAARSEATPEPTDRHAPRGEAP